MLDRSKTGYQFPPFTVDVEKGRILLFAKAIGEQNPIYTDEIAARQAGFRSIPVPPTFPFCLGKYIPDPADTLSLFALEFSDIVHGEQEFIYHDDICAGDTLIGQKRVIDIYDKKNGELEFIVVKTDFYRNGSEPVCEITQTIIVIRKGQ